MCTLRLLFILLLGITRMSFAETAFRSGQTPLPKVLVLIIANDDKDYYVEEQKIWRSYMHLDREHVEAYFIKGSPELEQPFLIVGDEIWSKTEETYAPGILNKTILSMEAMLPKLDEFDYVLRTNLSSFYYFPRLLEFLKTLPSTQCYSGAIGHLHGPFGSGAGFILSTDLVKMLINNKEQLLDNARFPDDVVIGHFFLHRYIPLISAKRLDFPSYKAFVKHRNRKLSKHYHFRLKHENENLRSTEEVNLQAILRNMFYGVDE
jgi:hypothetical protein